MRIFLPSIEMKVLKSHTNEALYARNPLTKKNKGMRKSIRKESDDECFMDWSNPICATWYATTNIMVNPRMASSHSMRSLRFVVSAFMLSMIASCLVYAVWVLAI